MYHQSTQLPLMVNDAAADDDEDVVHSMQPPGGCPDCTRTCGVDTSHHRGWAAGRTSEIAEPVVISGSITAHSKSSGGIEYLSAIVAEKNNEVNMDEQARARTMLYHARLSYLRLIACLENIAQYTGSQHAAITS